MKGIASQMMLFLNYEFHSIDSRGEANSWNQLIALDLEHGDAQAFVSCIPGDIDHQSEVWAALLPAEGPMVTYADGQAPVPTFHMEPGPVQRLSEWGRLHSRQGGRFEAKVLTEHYLNDRRGRGELAMQEPPWGERPFVGDRGRVLQVLLRLTVYVPAPDSDEEYLEEASCEVDLAREDAHALLVKIPPDLDERSRLSVVIIPAMGTPIAYVDGLAPDPESSGGIARKGRLRRIGDIGEAYGDLLRQEAILHAQDRLQKHRAQKE